MPVSKLAGVPILALGLALVGCSTSSPRTELPGLAAPTADDPMIALGYRSEWSTFAARTEGSRLARISVLGDVVVAQDSASVISLISDSTGEVRWATRLGSPLTKFLGTFREGKRLITSSDTELFFHDLDTGTLLTKQRLQRVVNTRPVQFGDILIFGTASNAVYGHWLNSGFEAFSYGIPGIIEVDPVMVTPDAAGLVTSTGAVIMLDAFGSARTRAQMFGGVQGAVAAGNSMLFVASLDQSIYAFEPYSNQPRWRVRTEAPLRDGVIYHEGRVYLTVPGAGVTALDALTGKSVWANKDVSGTIVAIRKGELLIWSGGTLTTVGLKDGRPVASATVPGVASIKSEPFVDGVLYVTADNGQVRKYKAR